MLTAIQVWFIVEYDISRLLRLGDSTLTNPLLRSQLIILKLYDISDIGRFKSRHFHTLNFDLIRKFFYFITVDSVPRNTFRVNFFNSRLTWWLFCCQYWWVSVLNWLSRWFQVFIEMNRIVVFTFVVIETSWMVLLLKFAWGSLLADCGVTVLCR